MRPSYARDAAGKRGLGRESHCAISPPKGGSRAAQGSDLLAIPRLPQRNQAGGRERVRPSLCLGSEVSRSLFRPIPCIEPGIPPAFPHEPAYSAKAHLPARPWYRHKSVFAFPGTPFSLPNPELTTACGVSQCEAVPLLLLGYYRNRSIRGIEQHER